MLQEAELDRFNTSRSRWAYLVIPRFKNPHSERLLKNRSKEPIEIRLLREGKKKQKRLQALAADKENTDTNINKTMGLSQSKHKSRQSGKSLGGFNDNEIIMDQKGNNTLDAYITEPENHKFLISASCLNTSQCEEVGSMLIL